MLRDLRIIYDAGTAVGLTDRQLLERFQSASRADDHDVAESALTALIERHAAMVWNVCRSLLRDRHDAEDAFQATFLILVRKAGSLLVGETLGPWLHVVAGRTAVSVRKAHARRRAVERPGVDSLTAAARSTVSDPFHHDADQIHAAIHAEIMILPESFRAVIVLCDLEGLSYSEAALRLKIPLGTVQSRLARARRRMRRGLIQRGIHPSNAPAATKPLCAPIPGLMIARGLPPALVRRVGRLGALIASDPVQWKATVAGSVRVLVGGSLRTMLLGRLNRILAIPLAGILLGAAVLYTDARSGQAAPDPARQQNPRAELEGRLKQPKEPIEIPSPAQLRASSGRGKATLYLLDRDENRIPLRRDGKVIRFQEVERELHWAVITGVIDHQQVQKSLIEDKEQPLLRPYGPYCRLELERQARREDGSWPDWQNVDIRANLKILDNMPTRDAERVPEPFLMDAIVDPLPHLTQGSWTDVDVDALVPPGTKARADRPIPLATPKARQQNRPPLVMVRYLDFTAEPGRTYRYRVRVVFFNPHLNQGNPPDRKKLIFSPWSEVTNIVTIPDP